MTDLDTELDALARALDRDLDPDAGARVTATLLARLETAAPVAAAVVTPPDDGAVVALAPPAPRPTRRRRFVVTAGVAAVAAAVVVGATVLAHQATTGDHRGAAPAGPVASTSATDPSAPIRGSTDAGPVVTFTDDDVATRSDALNAAWAAAGYRVAFRYTPSIRMADAPPQWTCDVTARKAPQQDDVLETSTAPDGTTLHVLHPDRIAPNAYLVFGIPRTAYSGMFFVDFYYDGLPPCDP